MGNWTIFILSIVFSGLFSGLELAFVSSSKLKIEIEKNKGSFAARVLSKFSRDPSSFIATLLVGNNIALVIYGIAASNLISPAIFKMAPAIANRELFMLLTLTIITTIIILFSGEFLPKVIFRINSNSILSVIIVPFLPIYYLLYPLTLIFSQTGNLILRFIFKSKSGKQNYQFSTIDLDEYLKEFANYEHHETEVKQEIMMFQNVIDFKTVKIRECMVPRTEIKAINIDDNIDTIKQMFIETGLSRILVYKNSLDESLGYIHSTDIFKNHGNLSDLLRPLLFFPEAMPANKALSAFISGKKNIAVILDEFGGISGLVTMEDILEEILGDITDEYDKEDLFEKTLNENEFIFSARLEIDYLNNKYHFDLPESEEYETLAGLIINYHESIPDIKDEIMVENFLFTVLDADETKIVKVKLRIVEKD